MEAAGTSGWGLRCNAHVAALHSQIEDMESQGFSFRVLAFKVVGHVIILVIKHNLPDNIWPAHKVINLDSRTFQSFTDGTIYNSY